MYIASAAHSIDNCLPTVFNLIKNKDENIELKKLHASEVALRVAQLCVLLDSSAKKTFIDNWDRNFGKYTGSGNTCTKYALEYADRAFASADALFTCGNLIERDYSSDSQMIEMACSCWKTGITMWKNIYALYDNHATRYTSIKSQYVSKLEKYDPEYVFSAPTYTGFPSAFAQVLRKDSDVDFGVSHSSSNTSGGCYVATAVYGSYDCPQVWTLRRFRDYKLAETWYGRAFIRTYYAISPTIVKWFGNTTWFKKMWKGTLDRMVSSLNSKGVADTPYEDRNW